VNEDPGATAKLKKIAPGFAWLPRVLRENLTPAALSSAVISLVGATLWVANARHELHSAQHDVQNLERSIQSLAAGVQQLHTEVAVMNTKIDGIASEQERQREWREHLEELAELPPHARRSK
jgi:hypothetical protein